MHQFIEQKRRSSHIARIFEERQPHEQYDDIGQKDDDTAHAPDNAIDEKTGNVGIVFGKATTRYPLAQWTKSRLDPIHRVLTQCKRNLE